MVSRQRSDSAMTALKMIPTKWAIAIVVVVIGYVLIQPKLNQWFGWKLPSVASMVGDEKPKPEPKATRKSDSEKAKSKASQELETESKKNPPAKLDRDAEDAEDDDSQSSVKKSNDSKSGKVASATKSEKNETKGEPDKEIRQEEPEDSDKVHGVLTEIGRNRFESPAGLIYGPGSEEGHRLKHIARHLEDQPSRPGPHGVFDGEMKEFLLAIDRTVTLASKGSKGTTKRDDEGSTIYEASFDKPIGFLGGTDGKRRKNPAMKKLRVVVRGKSVITAFPIL